MTCKELQQEEIEVLKSIYDGDECFKMVNECTFQYKIGENDNNRSLLLEVSWNDSYPMDKPTINMDTFYNKHILKEVKNNVIEKLLGQAEENLGFAMTYTLFEWAKENADSLMVEQPEQPLVGEITNLLDDTQISNQNVAGIKEKKVQLTKAQKRKMFDRLDTKGERPRGWDWVDIVKHLSQIGSSASNALAQTQTQVGSNPTT